MIVRMEDVLQQLVYNSELNRRWTTEEGWERIPNQAILHILRLERLPRSRAETAQPLDMVKSPNESREEAQYANDCNVRMLSTRLNINSIDP